MTVFGKLGIQVLRSDSGQVSSDLDPLGSGNLDPYKYL